MIDWRLLPRPILALAPMADMTDMPFCLMCKKYGNPVIFREMVSAEALIRGNEKTWKMASFDARERPIVIQIFGNHPEKMAQAARLLEERLHPDGIDINMGCPVRKIISNFDGSALIKDPERAAAIVKAVKAAISVPVSVKTRLGWSDTSEARSFVQKIGDAGADLITIHARTREQGYAGKADWAAAALARKEIPEIPFLINGDIVDADSAKRALEITGADGVMIGRGALGRPWIFGEMEPALGRGTACHAPTASDRTSAVLEHARLQIAQYGENAGIKKLRKHLPLYFKGDARWKILRETLVRVSTLSELEAALR